MATALDKAPLHVAAEQHVNAMQHAITEQHVNAIQHAMAEPPAKPRSTGGSNGIRARACSCSARSAAIRLNGDTGTRNSTAPHRPEPHDTEGAG